MRYKYFKEVKYISLPESSRYKVSAPLGTLYTPDKIDELVKKIISFRNKGRLVSSVGDRVTYTLISNDFIPDIAVIDGKEMRTKVSLVDINLFKLVIYVENRQGYVNIAIANVLKDNIESRPLLLFVKGEEDLVGFPIVLALPIGSYMLYGQPGKGIVLVEIDEEAKERTKNLLDLK